ncbi:hypothetical protein [Pseudomonas cichorii]|uniref:hypothetical protein n=1 Tax=Pseudomonas cichorii TaxID=36746 RepID=UPI001C8AC21D|nr:hypothetical protein [Pseudomonas cichorii]MBX8483410.1 hypothetical protein [Pseudomonas cichorii]MBX8513644.1 hypothetical protein [Pseudomonas cichorii]MBX8573869.1 hypothetical protein [Pseudomonas cichorii]
MNTVGVSEFRKRRQGRLQLLVLVLIAVGPMILATCMYRFNFWVPDSRSYHGQLIGNGQSRADLGVQANEPRWQLLVSAPGQCNADCQQLVYLARQVQIGLGRDATRASHALATNAPLSDDYAETLRLDYPQLQRYPLDVVRYRRLVPDDTPQLWIVDPHGNLVLRYDARGNGKHLLIDLRQLLKLSNIG